MSNITSSTYVATTQTDGRRQVEETHVDVVGGQHVQSWLADVSDDLDAALAVHASALSDVLRDAEITANIGCALNYGAPASFMFTFAYSTIAENISAFRASFVLASGNQALMMSDFLGSQTDAQLADVFGLNKAQITTLRDLPAVTPQFDAISSVVAIDG